MQRHNKHPLLFISIESFWIVVSLENKILLLSKLAKNTTTEQAYLVSVLNLEKKNVSFKKKEADLILANKNVICSICNDLMNKKSLKPMKWLTLTSNSFGSGSKI